MTSEKPVSYGSSVADKVAALVAPMAGDLGLEIYDIDYSGGVLKVVLDTPPGGPSGVSLDSLALVTRLLGRELDHSDPVPGRYTLEVTSPGLERTLRRPWHFQREIGKTVAIRLRDVEAGMRRVTGVLVSADESSCTVRIVPEGKKADPAAIEDRNVPFDRIDRARTVFEWGPTPKSGGPAGRSRPASGGSPGKPGRSTSKPAKPPADSSARKTDRSEP